jgi:hypothetical protein
MSKSDSFLKQWKNFRYGSQDESRMGMHTIQRIKLTDYGIKAQEKVQWDFTYLWLYGAVEPLSGASCFLGIYTFRYSVLREDFRAICQ